MQKDTNAGRISRNIAHNNNYNERYRDDHKCQILVKDTGVAWD